MKEVGSLSNRPGRKIRTAPFIAGGLSLVCYIFLSLICEVFPFGKFLFSLSDMTAQYVPFLALFHNKMHSLDMERILSNLTYSSQAGLGKNFMSTFGYYLASPFNLIYLFLDSSAVEGFVVVATILKFALSSAFMCLFLEERSEDPKSRMPILLSLIYAFSSYAVAYGFQIMWLDGYMLLPLLLYFTEKFMKKGRYIGLTITLLVLFVSNYYIAYMAGLMSFVYLLARLYTEKYQVKDSLKIIGKFILHAVLSAMIVCAVLLPTGLDTLMSADKTNYVQSNDYIRTDIVQFLGQFFLGETGDFGDVMPYNLPWLFLSLLVTSLIVIYIVSPVYKGRIRRVHIAGLIFMFLSVAVSFLDIAWQAFDEPNWFSHRHAFVFFPLMLLIAQRTIHSIKEVSRKHLAISYGIVAAILFLVGALGDLKKYDEVFLYNLVFISIYFLIFFLMGKKEWGSQFADMPRILPFLMALFVCFESVYLEPMLSSDLASFTVYEGVAADYNASILAMSEVGDVARLVGDQTSARRADNERVAMYSSHFIVNEGEAMFGNFHGMSFFNSSSNKNLHRYLKQLGYTVNFNYFAATYNFAAPSTDAFLSIGAVSSLRDYKLAGKAGTDAYGCGYNYYVNNNALDLGFAVDPKAYDFDYYRLESATDDKNYFDFQNDWYRSLFPDEFKDDFFISLPDEDIGDAKVTNAMTYDESQYKTHAEIEEKKEIEEGTRDKGQTDTSFDSDPLGRENTVSEKALANSDIYYRQSEKLPIVIEYEFIAPNTRELYLNLSVPSTLNDCTIYCNGIELSFATEGTFYSQILRLGAFEEGEKVKVSILADCNKFILQDINVAYFDYTVFDEQFDKIDKSQVSLKSFEDGFVSFDCNVKAGKKVVTTIPYEKGWTLKIDGKEAQIKPYQDALIGFDVPEGNHVAELTFVAPGTVPGIMVSCLGVVLLLAYAAADNLMRKKADQKQKSPKASAADDKVIKSPENGGN
ncbi:MAG: YfhO family protein [Clostridiales bacterium]|nr:YfhO family protein [Clostridiales bacterium]